MRDHRAIVGVGSLRGVAAVRGRLVGAIVWAWVLTIPDSAFIAGVFYWIGLLLFARDRRPVFTG